MICALGDLLLDVVVRLEGPLAEDSDTYGRTRVGAGGQAANVAAWAAELGSPARLVGKRASDAAGRLLADELRGRGVEIAGPEVETGTGTVVSIALPDGSRTMLTDRGVSVDFLPEELERSWVARCSWLHVPGYSLARSPLRDTALAAAGAAREGGARLSVDLSSTAAIGSAGVDVFRGLVTAVAPDVLFGNEDEIELVGELDAPLVVVKRGRRGALVRNGDRTRDLHALEVDFVDATGAGDAFAAGFLVGGGDVALAAAARCVARMGAMP